MAATTLTPDQQREAQLANLRMQIQQLNGATGIGAASQQNQLTAQYNALLQQKQQAAAQAQQAADQKKTTDAQAEADATRKQMLGLGQQGIDQLKGDTTDEMVRNFLKTQSGAQTLDPNAKIFGNGVPQYNAQGYQSSNYTAQGYNPVTGQAQSWDAAQSNAPQQIGGGGPWDASSIAAYNTQATDAAGAGEAARNQIIRDAILQSGGNASDPSLAGAYAESLSQRNSAQAQARNQIAMRATSDNFNAQRQADLANQSANLQNSQFNAGNRQQAAASNAAATNQFGLANMGAQNQAGQFNASAQNQGGMFNAQNQNQAAQFGAAANNQAGMFNTQNQMQGTMADFNAQRQAQQYNQQAQTAANSQLGSYNNQRQQMLQNAQQNQIGLLGQQRFQTSPTQPQQQMQFPTFQQFQSQPTGGSNVTYAPGYFSNMDNSRMGFQPSQTIGSTGHQLSGQTTSSFQNGYTGTPYYQQASQYVNKPPAQSPPILAAQIKKPVFNPMDF